MEKQEHARRLRQAIATSEHDRADIIEATGKGYRTVSNWVSETKPTMPDDRDRAILRRLFPGYDTAGDPVIVAISRSELDEWRKDTVKGFYRKHVAEQEEERGEVTG